MKSVRTFLALALVLSWTGAALAQFPKVDIKDTRTNPVIVQAFRSVVAVPSESLVRVLADGKEVAFGTVVDPAGWIITKWDEIRDKEKVVIKLRDGKELDAKLVGVETEFDLALLKIDHQGLKAIEWRPSKDAKVGRWVASVGMSEEPVAIGVVSVGTRPHVLGDQPFKFDVKGGFLGIGLAPGMGGAKINSVGPKTPGELAGLKVNDIVYEAAGRKILDDQALINTISSFKVGDKVLIKLKRGEEDIEITATLGARPKELLGNPQDLMGSELSKRRGGFPFILQHDTVLKPKDCGGPLVDLDGKAVGINIARAGRTETFAIPSEEVQKLLPDLKSGKLAPKFGVGKVNPLPKDDLQILRVASKLTDKDAVSKIKEDSHMKTYTVKLTSGVKYVIEMQSKDVDAYLIVEDAKSNKLAEDDNAGGDKNAKVLFTPAATGDFRVVVTTAEASQTGAFTLTVRRHVEAEKK